MRRGADGCYHSQLICYQRAVALRRAVYEESAKPAWRKDWKLRDDIRRSARSVAANISEGYWRYHHRDFLRFVDIALGSLGETEDHIESASLDDIIDDNTRATLVDSDLSDSSSDPRPPGISGTQLLARENA